jgi:hypothetical protein
METGSSSLGLDALLITRPPVHRIREAHGCERLVYASDPSNKESALRRHPQPKAVSTVRRKDLRKLLAELVAGTRKEPGREHSSVLEDRKPAGRFLTAPKPPAPCSSHPDEAVHAGISGDGLE